ncbi:MAG: hypothetical protein KME60_31455 [Cyanomargarita calcarea GSE-NOS-MK-12-04C]|jgi:hypothetical protein|uniref:Uncharacterized protein n=1 Tax=Cyanomargarita calcarea GSE-NOS-MK-12-04C TaxID=2839659 RepID=A0A951QU15_9CYAN|nr:hypothetical protein [Cyanomargarita calcarea GSE-NOS-MK-12-04C]
MTFDPNDNLEVVVVRPVTNEVVETEMVGETDELKRETKALIDAIKNRAQTEAQSAGTLTRETYLSAVRQAREAIERDKLIERDRIERSWATVQQEAESNWHLLMKEIGEFGDRVQAAGKAAWDAFNAPVSGK